MYYLPPYIRMIHGTAFPALPIERELFYRDDLNAWFIFDGTVWVNLQAAAIIVHGNAWHAPHFATEAALLAHIADIAAGIHGSSVAAVVDSLIHRDAAARSQIADPAVAADIDNLGARNAAIAVHAALATIHQDAPAIAAALIAIHAALDTGVHGAGADILATDADIAIHAALATVHQDAPALIAVHAALATVHQDAPALIAVHAALATGIHGVGASTVDSVAARDIAIAVHAALNAAGIHGSTIAATFNRLVHRDAAGRSKIVNPAINADIDNLGARNAAIAVHAALATVHQDAPALIAVHAALATVHQDAPALIAVHAALPDVHHAQDHAARHEPAGADPMAVDAVPATGSLRTLGAGAQQAMPGDAAPAPGAHEATHVDGGADEIDSALDPAAYPMLADTLAARPAAGVAGRFYWTTDEHILYRDTGAAWVKVAVADYPDLDGIPASFTPSAHESTHVKGGADDIDSALDARAIALANQGDIPYRAAAANTLAALAPGAAGQALLSGGVGANPSFGLPAPADHSHQAAGGGVGGKLDHGLALNGLADDDHPQYIKHSLATAVNDFLVASGAGVFVKKTLAQVKTLLDWAADIATHAALATGIHGVGGSTVDSVAARVAAIAAHAALTAAGIHGSTVAATFNRLVHRDAAGRSKIVNPAVAADIDNLGARDAAIAVHAGLATVHQDAPALIAVHAGLATVHQDAPALIAVHAALPTVHQDAPALIAVHAALDTGIHGVGAGIVGTQDKDKQIVDADGDSYVTVEKAADKDYHEIWLKDVQVAQISDVGIQTLPKQSGARAYQVANQTIPTGAVVRIVLQTESWDIQNEMNVTIKSGAADATEANKLHDADGGFAASDVGAWIWNTTDNTYTTVTAFVDNGELTLADDIMVNGENYKLYHSTFTATEDGYYQGVGNITYGTPVADKRAFVMLYKNGVRQTTTGYHSSNVSAYYLNGTDIVYLAANDVLDLETYHDMGGDEVLVAGTYLTWLSVQKVA